MSSLFSIFGVGEAGPVVHVAPHALFIIGGWPITNAIFYGWICTVVICAVLIWSARRVSLRPRGGFTQFVEYGVEFVSGVVESAFDEPAKGRKYVPYFIALFFFILFNNWLGLLPIVGEGFQAHANPLFRAFTADLNGTLAMGLVTMGLVYAASVRESGGFFKYLRHFFVGSPLNPMYFLIGIIEMITDLTRVFSLSLRLFLNITIGDIVISVFAYLGHVAAPVTALPFTLLEFGVDALQAYIFVILAVMYLAMTVNAHGSEGHDLTEELTTETIGPTRAGAAV